jgi:chaperonin GroES
MCSPAQLPGQSTIPGPEPLRPPAFNQTHPSLVRDYPGPFIIFNQEVLDMKVVPLQDRIVVSRIDSEEKTAGGIIIPDTAKEKPQEGKVIAVGPGKRDKDGKLIPLDVKAGDRVLFAKWAGTEFKTGGKEYMIMKEDDILGVIEP